MGTSHSVMFSDQKAEPGNPGLQRCLKMSLVPPVPVFSWTSPALKTPLFETMGKVIGPLGQRPSVCGHARGSAWCFTESSVARDRNIVTWNFAGVVKQMLWEMLSENVHSVSSLGNTRQKVVGNTLLRPTVFPARN